MTRMSRPSKASRHLIACVLGLSLFAAEPILSQTIRDFESPRGVVRLTLLPVAETPQVQAPEGDTAAPAVQAPPASAALDSISDFTSMSQLVRDGEGEMEVYFLDRASTEELRFPLRYSELRRYLLHHPIAYDQPTAAERNVALFADLAGALRVQMVEPADIKEKP